MPNRFWEAILVQEVCKSAIAVAFIAFNDIKSKHFSNAFTDLRLRLSAAYVI